MSKTTIGDIRDRANTVLDGMTANRTRVARDCLLLCDEVLRLREQLHAQSPEKGPIDFDSIFGRKP